MKNEEAFRAIWNELTRTGESRKPDASKSYINDCPACTEADARLEDQGWCEEYFCQFCPIDWCDDEGHVLPKEPCICEGFGEYGGWTNSETKKDRIFWARIIADKAWR